MIRDESLEGISPRTIKAVYTAFLVFYVIGLIGCVICGIILLANCKETVTVSSGYYYTTTQEVTNSSMLTQGIMCLTVYPLSLTLGWIMDRVVLGFFYDTKIIRYHLDKKEDYKTE